MHFPTVSTRGQSVPGDSLQHQRSFNGGLYNLPQQRTSLASHSLDDLDTSTSATPPNLQSSLTPSSTSSNHVTPNHHLTSLPPHPPIQNVGGFMTPTTSQQNPRPSKSLHHRRHETSQDRCESFIIASVQS